mmetsp:Transcript_19531/g.53596  ORF Transcript_19531/g.53596 Transcript_19531/m.53596 type:complete len:428 (-) Transcript_19531:1404-2687(-)
MATQLLCHPVRSCQFNIDGLNARFTGSLGGDQALAANAPLFTGSMAAPARRWTSDGLPLFRMSDMAYFEVTIGNDNARGAARPQSSNSGADGDSRSNDPSPSPSVEVDHMYYTGFSCPPCVSIGLSLGPFRLAGKQPGWDTFSLGYHGDDGCFFHGTGRASRLCGPSYGSGDTVGCGVHMPSLSVFFTLNGMLVGVPCLLPSELRDRGLPVYMTVGIDAHESISLNDGRTPFAYDPETPLPPHMLREALRAPLAFGSAVRFIQAANNAYGTYGQPLMGGSVAACASATSGSHTPSALFRHALGGLQAVLSATADALDATAGSSNGDSDGDDSVDGDDEAEGIEEFFDSCYSDSEAEEDEVEAEAAALAAAASGEMNYFGNVWSYMNPGNFSTGGAALFMGAASSSGSEDQFTMDDTDDSDDETDGVF